MTPGSYFSDCRRAREEPWNREKLRKVRQRDLQLASSGYLVTVQSFTSLLINHSMHWHFIQQDEQQGPVTDEQIKALIASGNLSADDLAWCEGMAEWKPIREITELSVRPRQTESSQDQSKNKTPTEYYNYEEVPWFRRSGINSLFVILGIFCIPPLLLFTVVMLITGDVYYNKYSQNGTLKKWSVANKVIAVIIFLFWVGIFVSIIFL